MRLYDHACTYAKLVSENARDRIRELKAQEVSYDKHLKDFERLCNTQEVRRIPPNTLYPHSHSTPQAATESLLSLYPGLLEDSATRRADQVNAASVMSPHLLHLSVFPITKRISSQIESCSASDGSQELLEKCSRTCGRS
jgi:hypothetical protein